MARLRDRTLGDVAGQAARYRPFAFVIVGLVLLAVLPAARRKPAELAAGAPPRPGTVSVPSVTRGDGEPVEAPAAQQAPDASRTLGGPVRRDAPAARAPAAPVTPRAVVSAATASGGCDPARGRLGVPSVYAPPCVPPHSGDNGGATSRGVSKDEIVIAVFQAQTNAQASAFLAEAGFEPPTEEETRRAYADYVDYFQSHYETYGRKVRLVYVKASGNDDDETAAKADAIKVASELKAFASLGGYNNTGAYATELAHRGVLCLGCIVSRPIEFYLDRAPHVWTWLLALSQSSIHRAEYIGKRLWGRKAQWAGDPLMQQQQRVLGYISVETDGSYDEGHKFFLKELERYGARVKTRVVYYFDLTRGQEQARTVIAKLKDEGVTTVIVSSDPFYPAFFTQEATRQQYFPEWVITGSALTDTTLFARTYDQSQWKNAFGVSFLPARGPENSGDAYRLYVWHHGREPAAEGPYLNLWMLYTGVHLAGPGLTATTFRDGLFAFPPSPPAASGITNLTVSFGRHGFWRWDDYVAFDDTTEIWWDPSARGKDETGIDGVGMYRYVEGGRRYMPGQWPTSEPKAFDPAGTVVVYEQSPEQDRPPQYEHRRH